MRVPELDSAVSGTTATSQDSALVRTPSNGLDGSLMLAPLEGRLRIELFPHHELVIVASTSELSILAIPL